MRTAPVILAALATLVAGAASAKKPELLPTGNTIGGPGLVTVAQDEPKTVLLHSSATPIDLCLTLVNVGAAGTLVTGIVRDPGMVANSNSPSGPGEAATVCRNASDTVRIQCTTGPTCKALWRVDQPR